jgi:hypothetical protein
VIDGMYNQSKVDINRSARVAKRQNRLDRTLVKLEGYAPSNKKERKKEHKWEKRVPRLETKIARVMTKMDIMTRANGGGTGSGGTGSGGTGGSGNGSVPEPSIIALLGLGLVGIGVARRLRKKTR